MRVYRVPCVRVCVCDVRCVRVRRVCVVCVSCDVPRETCQPCTTLYNFVYFLTFEPCTTLYNLERVQPLYNLDRSL